ncbi:MAG TPA: hypothetical protein VIN77_16615, partial [Aurantimonas sp.]
STLNELKALWLGEAADPDRRASILRYRMAAAVLFGFVGFLFGLHPGLAMVLAFLDVALRPLLRVAFGAHQTRHTPEGMPATVRDGAGI